MIERQKQTKKLYPSSRWRLFSSKRLRKGQQIFWQPVSKLPLIQNIKTNSIATNENHRSSNTKNSKGNKSTTLSKTVTSQEMQVTQEQQSLAPIPPQLTLEEENMSSNNEKFSQPYLLPAPNLSNIQRIPHNSAAAAARMKVFARNNLQKPLPQNSVLLTIQMVPCQEEEVGTRENAFGRKGSKKSLIILQRSQKRKWKQEKRPAQQNYATKN